MYNRVRNKLFLAGAGLGSSLAFAPVAYADGITTPSGDAANTSNSIVKKVVTMITTIFFYIGIILLVWSIGMLALAFKNEDADSKSRAIMLMVVSIILIALKPVINGFLPSGVQGE